jgi:putative ABC transport system permease protein
MIHFYIKSFLRSIRKNRFFHTINLIGFLAGFLLLTVILVFVNQELSFDKFHVNSSRIYRIQSGGYGVTPLCLGEKLRNQLPEVDGIVRFSFKNLVLVNHNKKVETGKAYYVDSDIFRVFSFQLGRGDANTVLNAPFNLVISQTLANTLFGAQSPLGEIVRDMDGTVYTISGVMKDIPYNSHIQSNAFISIETLRRTEGEEAFNCGSWSNLTYLFLAKYSRPEETEKKLNTLLVDSRMGTRDEKLALRLEPLRKIYFDSDNNKFDGTLHGDLQTVVVYIVVSILTLLIVIVNYINLSTAISGSRIKEMAIQKIIGANRIRIITQYIFESIGVAIISFICALLIIELFLPQISQLLNLPISPLFERSSFYVYYFIGIVIIGLITGLFPGVVLSEVSELKMLKNETVFSSRGIQRKILLAFQLIIVAVLMNCTFGIKKQIAYIFTKDIGLHYENVLYFNLDQTLQLKHELLKNALLKNPGIEMVSFSNALIGDGLTKRPIRLNEIDKNWSDREELFNFYSIDPDYLNLYEIRLKHGRNFSSDMATDSNNSLIINEAACKAFGIINPVGKTIFGKEIIGVVHDFNFASLHSRIEPLVLYCGDYKVIQMKLKTENREATIDYIKNTCKSISPDFECDISFMDNRIQKLYKSELDLRRSFEIYSMVTLLLALLGLFALTLFQSGKRTKEICIRKLYGAGFGDTFKRLIKEQILIVMLSNVISIPISLFILDKWFANFPYHTQIGSLVFIATMIITIVFNLLSVFFIIIKTYRMNLSKMLKHE